MRDHTHRFCRGADSCYSNRSTSTFLSSVQRLVPRPHSSLCQVYIKPHCQFPVLSSVFSRGFLLTPTHLASTTPLPFSRHRLASSLTERQPPGFRKACHLPIVVIEASWSFIREVDPTLVLHRSGLSAVSGLRYLFTPGHCLRKLHSLFVRTPTSKPSSGRCASSSCFCSSTLKFNFVLFPTV